MSWIGEFFKKDPESDFDKGFDWAAGRLLRGDREAVKGSEELFSYFGRGVITAIKCWEATKELRVGDKVVCIKDTPWYKKGDKGVVTFVGLPERNEVSEFTSYSVRFEGDLHSFGIMKGTIECL